MTIRELEPLIDSACHFLNVETRVACGHVAHLAPLLSCWAYGHPSQPGGSRRYRERPWRCARCETWWVTERDYSAPFGDLTWVWRMVEPTS